MLKKSIPLLLLICLFTSCYPEYVESLMPIQTDEQICKKMNDTFMGKFTVISGEKTDSNVYHGNKVLLNCSTLKKPVTTTHCWRENNLFFNWTESYTTDYYWIKYEDKVKEYYRSLAGSVLGDTEFKLETRANDILDVNSHFLTLESYMSDESNIAKLVLFVKADFNQIEHENLVYEICHGKMRAAFYVIYDKDIDLASITEEKAKDGEFIYQWDYKVIYSSDMDTY